MPDQAFMQVSYEGATYSVPSELMSADVRNGTTLVQQYIQEEIADKQFRVEQSKAKQERAYESEFSSIQKRLSAIESKDKIIDNLQLENASLAAAVEAQAKQIQALEASGADAGSASAEARKTAYDLANASTIAHGTLTELMRSDEVNKQRLADMEARLDEYDALFKQQADNALAAGQNRQRLEQEQSVRLISDVAKAQSAASEALSVASEAKTAAESAQVLNDGKLTKADITTAVTAELAAQAPAMVDRAIETIKQDEFLGGSIFGQRVDGDQTRRRRSDASNYLEGRQV